MTRKFQRKIENFICENCGHEVKGNGYTNHCPECLWSKHVDINPGDRLSECKGMMAPADLEMEEGRYIIIHQCVKCGYKKRNRKSENDNYGKILALSNKLL